MHSWYLSIRFFYRSLGVSLFTLTAAQISWAALVCEVDMNYTPSNLSKDIALNTEQGDAEFLGKKLVVKVPTEGLLDDWRECDILASHGDSDPKLAENGYRYASLQLRCEGKNNTFVRSFLANFLPGDEGTVHGEALIVDGYSGKVLLIETACTFQKG